jgi:hypothetical protein
VFNHHPLDIDDLEAVAADNHGFASPWNARRQASLNWVVVSDNEYPTVCENGTNDITGGVTVHCSFP